MGDVITLELSSSVFWVCVLIFSLIQVFSLFLLSFFPDVDSFYFNLTICSSFFPILDLALFCSASNTLFEFPSAECNSHKNLSDSNRIKSFNDKNVVLCDTSLANTWYRFVGAAGNQIAESEVPTWHCGTHAPGWLNGTHPSEADGAVDRQVCFHWTGGNCQWSKNIQVRNCGDFYVYKLVKPPGCSMRYCGEQAGKWPVNLIDNLFVINSRGVLFVSILRSCPNEIIWIALGQLIVSLTLIQTKDYLPISPYCTKDSWPYI